MAQYLKIETIGSIGSIILAILEVQIGPKDPSIGASTVFVCLSQTRSGPRLTLLKCKKLAENTRLRDPAGAQNAGGPRIWTVGCKIQNVTCGSWLGIYD